MASESAPYYQDAEIPQLVGGAELGIVADALYEDRQADLAGRTALRLASSESFDDPEQQSEPRSRLRRNVGEYAPGEADGTSSQAALGRLAAHDLLSAEQEVKLAKRVELGDESARQEFIEKNLRLVISYAYQYAAKARSMTEEDLTQEGVFGLMRAIDKFDYRRGYRFSTYATNWIRQSMQRAIDYKDKTIRLPSNVAQTYRNIGHAEQELIQRGDYDPSAEAIADEVNKPTAEVIFIRAAALLPASLDKPLSSSQDGSATLASVVPSSEMHTDEAAIREVEKLELHKAIRKLPPDMADAVWFYYGLDGFGQRNYAETSRIVNMGREKVTQLVERGLEELVRILDGRESSYTSALAENYQVRADARDFGDFANLCLPRQLDVLELLYKEYEEIASELGMSNSTVRTHVSNIIKNTGFDSVEEVALVAADKGVIPMAEVPAGRALLLAPEQRKFLQDYFGCTYKEIEEATGMGRHTIVENWKEIYVTTKANSRRQAVIMAYKDKLIEAPDL